MLAVNAREQANKAKSSHDVDYKYYCFWFKKKNTKLWHTSLLNHDYPGSWEAVWLFALLLANHLPNYLPFIHLFQPPEIALKMGL